MYVRNRPGVLVRVALIFARRGYNIESLVVSPVAEGDSSRMTITCSGDPAALEQIIKPLHKLVDVVHALDHTGDEFYETTYQGLAMMTESFCKTNPPGR